MSITLRTPDGMRRRRQQIGPFESASLPTVAAPKPREPQRALDFLRGREHEGDGTQPSPATQAFLRDAESSRAAATSLREMVDLLPWYHTIDLGDGVVTPGNHDHRDFIEHIGIPDDLTGLRVLDVATFDGFWAFEFERRGAEVVAIDLPSAAALDWPHGAREVVEAEALDVPFGTAFAVAREALDSSVERRACSVYELADAGIGEFDIVFIGDLLLHLARPLDALRSVRSVCRDRLIMVDRFDPTITGTDEMLLRYRGGWDGLEWWAPSLETLTQWVVDAGFAAPDIRGIFRVRDSFIDDAGWYRAVLHLRIRP